MSVVILKRKQTRHQKTFTNQMQCIKDNFFPIIDFNIKFNADESYLKYNIKLK